MNSQQNPDLAVHPLAIPMEGLLGESATTLEKNVIATQLSEEAQVKLEVIQSLLEPCDRTTYGQKLRKQQRETKCIVANGTKVGEKLGTRWLSRTHSNK